VNDPHQALQTYFAKQRGLSSVALAKDGPNLPAIPYLEERRKVNIVDQLIEFELNQLKACFFDTM
jgi:hypothetical protein